VIFVGESPGAEEVKQGLSFVGPTGEFLKRIVRRVGIKSAVFENACMCYKNPKPSPEQYAACRARLHRVLKQLDPKVIVALGEFAMKALGLRGSPIKRNGEVENWEGYPVVISVHPAFVLRDTAQSARLQVTFSRIATMLESNLPASFCVRLKTRQDLRQTLARIKEARTLTAMDIETAQLEPSAGAVLCVALAWRDAQEREQVVWFGVSHRDEKILNEGDFAAFLRRAVKVVPEFVFQGAKFELSWFRRVFGVDVRALKFHDTMLRSWVIDENESHGLGHLGVAYGNLKPWWWHVGRPEEFATTPLTRLGRYCATDALACLRVFVAQESQLDSARRRLLTKILYPATLVLERMEEVGVQMDPAAARKALNQINNEIATLERRLGRWRPGVNWNSPKQVAEVIFGDLKLPVVEKTSTGRPSTRQRVLERLAGREKHIKLLADYKKQIAIRDNFLIPLLNRVDEQGRIHSNFNIGQVVTGRLSSSNPNMQNLPRKGIVRTIFRSRYRKGRLVKADYAQHELRVAAAESRDPQLTLIFKKGGDPHLATAAAIYNKHISQVTKEERQQAKRINFALVSGLSMKGLMNEFGFPLAKARQFYNRWFRLYSGIAARQKALRARLYREGIVTSLFGRIRHLPGAMSEDEERRAKAVNQALNFPIQAGGTDLVLAAMVEVDKALRGAGLKAELVLTVHDSLVVDCPAGEVRKVVRLVKQAMEGFDIGVPLKAEIEVGTTLAEEKQEFNDAYAGW